MKLTKKFLNNKNISKELNKNYYSDEFIDFKKILFQLNDSKEILKNWNKLIGKKNIKKLFFDLIKEDINNIKLVSLLLATRWEKFTLIKKFDFKNLIYISYEDLEKIYIELEKTRIFDILKNNKISNLKDYLFGVLAGMDTNARKNRNGKRFENKIKKLLFEYNIEFEEQIILKKYLEKNSILEKLPLEIKDRRIDFLFILNNKKYFLEVNTYNYGGSKIDKTSTDFQKFNEFVEKKLYNFEFIWVSGGGFWDKNTAIKIRNKKIIKNFFNFDEFYEWILKNK